MENRTDDYKNRYPKERSSRGLIIGAVIVLALIIGAAYVMNDRNEVGDMQNVAPAAGNTLDQNGTTTPETGNTRY
jgi:hypothetical protein